jgi:hypothetical protein
MKFKKQNQFLKKEKKTESTRIHSTNPPPVTWDWDKKIIFSKKWPRNKGSKLNNKKTLKKPKLLRVNLMNLQPGITLLKEKA